MKGSVAFRYEATHDCVVASPRWTLDSVVDVMRWYQISLAFFSGRFASPRDLVVLNEQFAVSPRHLELWANYRSMLHAKCVRCWVDVAIRPDLREAASRRPGAPSREAPTFAAALDAVLATRQHDTTEMPALPGSQSRYRCLTDGPVVEPRLLSASGSRSLRPRGRP